MAKMWTSNEEFDFETAKDHTTKLVLLACAHRAGIFDGILEEQDLATLKRVLKADERALFIVLEALCSLGYAHKRSDRYVITEKGRAHFIEQGKDYVGGSLPHFLDIMEAWIKLPEILKETKPEKEESNVPAFMNAMASKPDKVVDETVNYCLIRKKNAKTVLDLGGGPGKYSKAFVNRGLNAVLYDLPDTIEYVRTHFDLGNIKNLTLKKGDFTNEFVNEFPNESFDIVFMGNICHIYSEKENREIMERVGNILGSNGMIAIEDYVRGRSPMAEMFAVNMLANTEGGNTYTQAQYTEWLIDAGFCKIEVIDIAEKRSQLITAFWE